MKVSIHEVKLIKVTSRVELRYLEEHTTRQMTDSALHKTVGRRDGRQRFRLFSSLRQQDAASAWCRPTVEVKLRLVKTSTIPKEFKVV